MKYLVSIILLLGSFVCALLALILFSNQAPVFTTPGLAERLKVYFRQNSAHTEAQHRFPELRSAEFQVSAETLYLAVQTSLLQLGWTLSAADEDSSAGRYQMRAVVTTPVFRFQDDVMIQIHSQTCRQNILHSVLDMQSSSRLGKADLAANAGHIQKLFAQVRQELARSPPTPSSVFCE